MRNRYVLMFALAVLVLGCSGDDTPLQPGPGTTLIGESIQADGTVELMLNVFLVRDDVSERIEAKAQVENTGTATLRFDHGGCGCPTPVLRIVNETGEACEAFDPLCPCWAGVRELEATETAVSGRTFPTTLCGVAEEPHYAIASFSYWTEENDGWVQRSIEVTLAL